VSLGDITKQFAKQAIGDTVKGVIDPQPAGPVDPATTIVNQVQAMQKALREDDELVVLYPAGNEMVRIFEIFLPSKSVLVLSGVDPQKNTTRIIAPVEAVQLVCKIGKVTPPGKPARVNIVIPKT
jgi:hypothetical protein